MIPGDQGGGGYQCQLVNRAGCPILFAHFAKRVGDGGSSVHPMNEARLLARFRFRQPAASQLLRWDAGEIGFDIENGRSIEHVEAPDVQNGTLAAKQLNDG